jgi:hypothetical protein
MLTLFFCASAFTNDTYYIRARHPIPKIATQVKNKEIII